MGSNILFVKKKIATHNFEGTGQGRSILPPTLLVIRQDIANTGNVEIERIG